VADGLSVRLSLNKTLLLAEVVSKRVRSLRERRGWSLSELARRAGIGVSTLSEIEAGQSAPRLDTLGALAHALGAPLETFLHAKCRNFHR